MTLKWILICAGSLVWVSCNSNEKIGANESASGTYVREYSHEIVNTNSGNKVGMRKVRDTIFVEQTDQGYLISNSKWRLNDYDQDGWTSMEHSEDKPLPTFQASYDESSSSLIAKNEMVSYPLFLDSEKNKLYKGKSRNIEYRKIK
jgi:hypothetical protein